MAQLIVRNIEDEVAQKLKERAAHKGVSTEEEHRRILREAVQEGNPKPEMDFKEFLMHGCGTDVDVEFPGIEGNMREIDLSN
jgi:plasmid stability protein